MYQQTGEFSSGKEVFAQTHGWKIAEGHRFREIKDFNVNETVYFMHFQNGSWVIEDNLNGKELVKSKDRVQMVLMFG